MIEKFLAFVRKHPARVYALLAAVATLAPAVIGGVPVPALLAVAGALLGVGESVQRTENAKTDEALLVDPATLDPEAQGH